MNTSQRQYRNKDVISFNVYILDLVNTIKFVIDNWPFVKYKFDPYTGLVELSIDFSVYGRLDKRQEKEFNNLRKQSFTSIPENAFQDEINRFNKRKWKRKNDSKPKTKKLKHSPQNPILHHQQERDSSPYLQAATMECDGSDINEQTNTDHLSLICNILLDQNSAHNYQDRLQQDYNNDTSKMTEQTTESGRSLFQYGSKQKENPKTNTSAMPYELTQHSNPLHAVPFEFDRDYYCKEPPEFELFDV